MQSTLRLIMQLTLTLLNNYSNKNAVITQYNTLTV